MGEAGSKTKAQSLTDVAYDALVKGIVQQAYQPGTPLSIDGLARQLSMSNTPVREALMRANGERLVRQKINHGFIVADLLTAKEIRQLFDLRSVLEIHALESAAVSNAGILELKRAVEQMENAADTPGGKADMAYLQLDHDFHRALVSMAGSDFTLKAWEDLHVHLHLARLYNGSGFAEKRDSFKEHRGLLKALQRGEKDEAVSLLGKHLRRAEKRLAAVVKR